MHSSFNYSSSQHWYWRQWDCFHEGGQILECGGGAEDPGEAAGGQVRRPHPRRGGAAARPGLRGDRPPRRGHQVPGHQSNDLEALLPHPFVNWHPDLWWVCRVWGWGAGSWTRWRLAAPPRAWPPSAAGRTCWAGTGGAATPSPARSRSTPRTGTATPSSTDTTWSLSSFWRITSEVDIYCLTEIPCRSFTFLHIDE